VSVVSEENVALSGVEEIHNSVKELLERIHFILTSGVNEDILKHLNEVEEKAQSMLKQAIINSIDSLFKKDFIGLIAKDSLNDVDINKVLYVLDKIENNEIYKNLVSYLIEMSEQIQVNQTIYNIEFEFYLPFVYNKKKYLLPLADIDYIKDKDKLIIYIGDYGSPVFKISEYENEVNKNTLENQLKGLLSLIDIYKNKINEVKRVEDQ
jgi:hypothetical protein